MGKLIIDCGGTKAEWSFIKGKKTLTFHTKGYNPFVNQDISPFREDLKKNITLNRKDVSEVHFYGAGLIPGQNTVALEEVLANSWPNAVIQTYNDLLAAARGCSGSRESIVCILGTGSNSCHYDGKQIVKNVGSLGYLLGDEGSGAHMGKLFVKRYLRGQFDADISNSFEKYLQVPKHEMLRHFYESPFPNRSLAACSKFIHANMEDSDVKEIASEAIIAFFLDVLSKYEEIADLPVFFTGSISFHYQELIRDIARSQNIAIAAVTKSPMKGLVKWHDKTP